MKDMAMSSHPDNDHASEVAAAESDSNASPASADNQAASTPPRRSWWSRWWKRLLIICGSLFLLMVILTVLIGQQIAGAVGHQIAEKLANEYLTVPVSIDDVKVRFLPPAVTVTGIDIGIPEGVPGSMPLLRLEEVHVYAALYSMMTDTAIIREVRVQGLAVGAQRLADGSFTFEHVLEPEFLVELVEPKPPKPKSSLEAFLLDRKVYLADLSVHDVDLRFGDAFVGGGWSAFVEGLFVRLQWAQVDLQNPKDLSMEGLEVGFAGFEVAQPPGHKPVAGPGFGEPFVQAKELAVQLAAWQGLADTVAVEEVGLASFAAVLTRHDAESTSVEDLLAYLQAMAEDGKLRLQAMLENPLTGAAGALVVAGAVADESPASEQAAAAPLIPPLWLQNVAIGPGRVTVVESTLADEPIGMTAENIHLQLADLRANILGEPPIGEPGRLNVSGTIVHLTIFRRPTLRPRRALRRLEIPDRPCRSLKVLRS
jgi:hypothetical protein